MTDELEVRVARMVVPARGVQDRQAVLPGPLRAFHRALLGAFLAGAGPPDRSVVGQLAAELALEPRAALAVLAAADLVRTDPATSRVSVAYPVSAVPASHRVELAGTAAAGDACSRVADCCCPHINFHASPATPTTTVGRTRLWPPSCSTRPRESRRPGGASPACSIGSPATTRPGTAARRPDE
jgi:hypothetical protein